MVSSVFMYFGYRDEVATIDAMQSITEGFNRDVRRITGVSTDSTRTDLRNNAAVRESLESSRFRVLLVFAIGVSMAVTGSWLIVSANDT